MTPGRAAMLGAGQRALIGLLFALLFNIFFTGPEFVELLLYSLALGALFGAVYGGLFQYAASGGKRDFVSASTIQADRYEVQVDEEAADEAMRVLGGMTEARSWRDTIVVLRFNDLDQARHALDELKRLDRKRRLQVSAAALVERPAEGRIDASGGSEDADGFYLPKGGIVGLMVDALSGPTGAVFARPTESFRGHTDRPGHEPEREFALQDISKSLEPGVVVVIAEITDPDPGVLDAELAALGGSVTRRAARDVYAELQGR